MVDTESLALEAIRDVGPGGHFFGTAHTMERYQTAFYSPLLSNWDNHPNWLERGVRRCAHAGQRRSGNSCCADYEQPPIDPGIVEALDAFIAMRKAEGGAPMN